MQDLTISIVQSDLQWEDRKQNLQRFESHLHMIKDRTDVVVLCEMFTTGFSMDPVKVAEKHHPDEMETLNWMRKWAAKLDAVITGSVSVEEHGNFFNRLYWVLPDGRINTYDKRHLFSFAGEDQHYNRGYDRIIEEWRGWKICPLICYDLRFPVWSRNVLIEEDPAYDLLIYVANWPEARREPWSKLLLARAIENQVYVAGCNRVGYDGNGHGYSGDSVVIDPRGNYIYQAPDKQEDVCTVTLLSAPLMEFREKFPVLRDADPFDLRRR